METDARSREPIVYDRYWACPFDTHILLCRTKNQTGGLVAECPSCGRRWWLSMQDGWVQQ